MSLASGSAKCFCKMNLIPRYFDTSSKGGKAKACVPCLLKCLSLTCIFGNGRIYGFQL